MERILIGKLSLSQQFSLLEYEQGPVPASSAKKSKTVLWIINFIMRKGTSNQLIAGNGLHEGKLQTFFLYCPVFYFVMERHGKNNVVRFHPVLFCVGLGLESHCKDRGPIEKTETL